MKPKYNLNGIQIPQIKNLSYGQLEDIREAISLVLDIDEADIEILADDNKTNEPWEG